MRARLAVLSPGGPLLRFAVPAAVALHLLPLLLLLPGPTRRPVGPGVEPATVEIEMVDQAAQRQGAPAEAGEAARAAPASPEPPPPPEPRPREAGAVPPPPPPPAPARAPSAVNLGNAAEDQDPLLVTGDNVVPPRPDAAFRNRPPAYPPESARRGKEGDVLVRALVGTAGVPERVDVLRSSGDAAMDRAAADAVSMWRFQPARNNGAPVPFEYEVNIQFRLGRERGTP